jgi:hypothetical protein
MKCHMPITFVKICTLKLIFLPLDMIKMKLFVPLNRFFALKYAADAASTVLRVDQVRNFSSGFFIVIMHLFFYFIVVNIW